MAKPRSGSRTRPTTDPNRRLTKAEKTRQARLERVELQRKMAKRRRTRRVGLIGGVAVAAVVALVLVLLSNGGGTPIAGGSGSPSVTVQLPEAAKLPGILRTSSPWPDNTAELPQRLAALHLPQLSDTVLHHHTDLLIYVNGQPVTVPANVGLITAASPLHTHTASGTIHTESADPNLKPVLGQFFDVWGVYLTPDCLGGSCATGDTKIRAYVDGQEWTGDPTQIPLNDQSVVVLTFGTLDQVPNPIPTTFTVDGATVG